MIKRVNFTGRRRIPRDRVTIEVFDGPPRSFNAQIELAGISLPGEAAVVLEAMCAGSNVIERFEFGVAGDIRPPADRRLSGLESENVFFTLKVVDRSERVGRILGMAEHIRPERAGPQTTTGKQGILAIEAADLGDALWRLEFNDHSVSLLVNRDIAGLKERARYDAFFYAIVYPEVVRRILAEAIEENADADEEDERWQTQWLRFGRNLYLAGGDPPKASDLKSEREEWIEEVVAAFCKAHKLKDKFAAELARTERGES